MSRAETGDSDSASGSSRPFVFELCATAGTLDIVGHSGSKITAALVFSFLRANKLIEPSAHFASPGISPFGHRSRHRGGYGGQSDEDDEDAEVEPLANDGTLQKATAIKLFPSVGEYAFTYGAMPCTLKVSVLQEVHEVSQVPFQGLNRKLDVSLIIVAPSLAAAEATLGSLFSESIALAESEKGNLKQKIRVVTMTCEGGFCGGGGATLLWKRPLSTIYLPDAVKLRARTEIADFLSSKDDYRRFGIPYRRTFLLAGPPGMGKTSLIHALASEFDRAMYVVSIGPQSSDTNVSQALRGIQDKVGSFVVLEDVDVLFNEDRKIDEKAARHSVSFSGLLNALDGLSAPSGVIVFLTTNHIDRLDPALLRPGRIDTILTVSAPTPAQLASMYDSLLGADKADVRDELLKRISAAGLELSTAVFQKFLFDNRKGTSSQLLAKLDELQELVTFYSQRASAAGRKPPESMFG
jgi:hypothetical protein